MNFDVCFFLVQVAIARNSALGKAAFPSGLPVDEQVCGRSSDSPDIQIIY